MSELFRKLRFLLNRHSFERDLDEEMRHHLALKAEDECSPGIANSKFGNITLLKENSRAMWTWTFWEQFLQDIRYGLRAMAANRIFTAIAVLSLALGIGANTAIYSFMEAVLLRNLPVRNPRELVVVKWRSTGGPQPSTLFPEPGTGKGSGDRSVPTFPGRRTKPCVQTTRFLHTVCLR